MRGTALGGYMYQKSRIKGGEIKAKTLKGRQWVTSSTGTADGSVLSRRCRL